MSGFIRIASIAMTIAAVVVSVMPDPASAQMGERAIEARKGLMKSNSRNMKVIAAFVKKGEGTASAVAMSAREVAANTAAFPNNFPAGTSQGGGMGKTRAKAEIWQSWPKFTEASAKSTKLALDLAMAAESGDKGAIGAAMGAVGKSCGGCHKAFRGPKN